jgi:hypothetical protein
LEPRKAAHGVWLVEELQELLEKALLNYGKPKEQVDYLNGSLNGRELIVVGTVTSIKDDRINISAHALLELPLEFETITTGSPQKTLDEPKEEPMVIEATEEVPPIVKEMEEKIIFAVGVRFKMGNKSIEEKKAKIKDLSVDDLAVKFDIPAKFAKTHEGMDIDTATTLLKQAYENLTK